MSLRILGNDTTNQGFLWIHGIILGLFACGVDGQADSLGFKELYEFQFMGMIILRRIERWYEKSSK